MTREEYIKKLVFMSGHSLKSFAKTINLPYSTFLSMLTRGIGSASFDIVFKVCQGLNITMDDLQRVECVDAPHNGQAISEGDSLMTINQRIKLVRTTLILSQASFAKAIAVTRGYIANIEAEKSSVSDQLIRLVSITFNVREHWLKTGEGAMLEEPHNKLAELAFAVFLKLKPEYQGLCYNQMEQLLEIQNNEASEMR